MKKNAVNVKFEVMLSLISLALGQPFTRGSH